MQRLLELIAATIRSELRDDGAPGLRREAAVRHLAGAFLQVLTWWLTARTGLQLEELEGVYRDLTTPVLAVLGSSTS